MWPLCLPDVGVPDCDQPRCGLDVLAGGEQPPGEVIQTPGPREVKAVQVNQVAVCSVHHLDIILHYLDIILHVEFQNKMSSVTVT